MLRQLPCRDEFHHPEPARIVEDNRASRRHVKDDMIVWVEPDQRARGSRPRALADHAKRSGHTEVHQQRLTRRQRRDEVLRAPIERRHGLTGEPLDESACERPPQIRASQIHGDDAAAHHAGGQGAACRFDLGKFRHLPQDSVSTAVLATVRTRP
jgi:hypothetical protein